MSNEARGNLEKRISGLCESKEREPRANRERMSNEQLVILIQDHINEADNMLELWENNRGFIYKMARQYSGYEDIEDLLQVGYIGLCEAVDHYNASEGVLFLSYASFWIRQAMRRHIVNNGSSLRIPEYMANHLFKYRRLLPEYEKKFGREPTRREIRALLGVSWEMLEGIEKAAVSSNPGSIDIPIEGTDGLTVADSVAAPDNLEKDMLDKIWQEELGAKIWPLVDSLPDEQPAVIRARFQEGKTLEETGAEIGLDRNRARSIENKALRTLRNSKYTKQLRPFIEDLAMPLAYRGGTGAFRMTGTSSTERAVLKLLNWQC